MGELNLFDLNSMISKYKLNTFVETGTGAGDGLRHAAKSNFKKLYSVEIIPELYKKVIEEFKNDTRINILNLNSLEALNDILDIVSSESRILFWLDAHFPGADFHLEGYSYHDDIDKKIKLPLKDELELIVSKRQGNDVFIIDDLNLYEDGNFECGQIREDLRYLRDKYDLHGIQFIKDLFPNYNLKKYYRHQGFIILTPNEK